jgi:hypothetical protein
MRMEPNEKAKAMNEAAKQLIDLIQKRLSSRVETLNSLAGVPTDNLPVEIKKMREEEASKLRAVMQEQKDIIELAKMLFPNA